MTQFCKVAGNIATVLKKWPISVRWQETSHHSFKPLTWSVWHPWHPEAPAWTPIFPSCGWSLFAPQREIFRCVSRKICGLKQWKQRCEKHQDIGLQKFLEKHQDTGLQKFLEKHQDIGVQKFLEKHQDIGLQKYLLTNWKTLLWPDICAAVSAALLSVLFCFFYHDPFISSY